MSAIYVGEFGYSDCPSIVSSYKFRSKRRDALGRILQKTQTVNDNPANPSTYTTTTYHPGGQVASIRYPSGLQVFYRLGTGTGNPPDFHWT